jgi:4-amino-4-deoxy-L-arabinose transferase-like glycosyltransferase
MNEIQSKTSLQYGFLIFAILIFILGTSTKLNVPIVEWDQISLEAAKNWADGINREWIFDHPPLYAFFLTILFKLFGASVIVARMGNISIICLTALVMFRLSTHILNRRMALCAVGFYLLNPVCIQGTNIMDVADTSLLPFCFTLVLYALKYNIDKQTYCSTALLSCSIGLCFWAKFSSSIALVASLAIGFFVIIFTMKNCSRVRLRPIYLTSAGMLLGLVMFLFTWLLISNLLWGIESSFRPFLSIPLGLSRHAQGSLLSQVSRVGYHTIRLLLWFSPYFILLWFIGIKHIHDTVKDDYSSNGIFLKMMIYSSFVYFIGYMVIGGVNWGYPRYHAAILPYISIIIGLSVSNYIKEIEGKILVRLFMISIFLGLIFSITSLINDPLLFLNLRIKEILIQTSENKSIAYESIQSLTPLYVIPTLIFFALQKLPFHLHIKKVFYSLILFGTLFTISFLNIQQLTASYRTSNQYGAEGKATLIKLLRRHALNGSLILALPEFTYEIRNKKISRSEWSVWTSSAIFCKYITTNKPIAIVAGMTTNTFNQLKWLFNPDTHKFLLNDYDFLQIGTYFLWLRHQLIGDLIIEKDESSDIH